MRVYLSFVLIISLQLYLPTSCQRGRSKYRPSKTSYFDPVSGIFRRTPYIANQKAQASTTLTTTTLSSDSTTSKVYKFFHHAEDVIISPSNIFDKKYKRPSVPKLNYDFTIGRDEVENKKSKDEAVVLLEDPNVESLKKLYDFTIGRDKEAPIVKKKKIYFDVEHVRPSDEIENSVEEDLSRRRPNPIINYRTNKYSTQTPAYFLPTIAVRRSTASPETTTTTTSTTITTSTTTTITTTEPERSTWRTTTTTEKQFTFSKKSSIRDHYRNMNKQGSRPQVAQPYPVDENSKFPHFPEQPLGSFPSFFTPKKGKVSTQTKQNSYSIPEDNLELIHRAQPENRKEVVTTTPRSRKTPSYDWNIKKRIRSKLNLNKKRRILSITPSPTTTTLSTVTESTTTEITPSGQLETRNRYFYTKSDIEPETLQQNPDIYRFNAKTTTPVPVSTVKPKTAQKYYIEDFRPSIPSAEELAQVSRFQTYLESLDHPKVPNLLEFHPSYQEHDFTPRDNFYNRLEELEEENEYHHRRKPIYIPRNAPNLRRKGQRRHDRPRLNRRARRPNRRSRHPDSVRQRFNQSYQRRRGLPQKFN